jgi:hypothetical protein
MDENKSGLYIVAIVGVIAAVALVVLVLGASARSSVSVGTGMTATADATGQVTQKACYFCSCSKGDRSYGTYGGHSNSGNCASGETEKCWTVSCEAP